MAETPTRGTVVLHDECLATKPLTAREQEVMRHVEGGMSTDEIAHALCVTPGTVSKHLEHIYRKLGVTSRAGATRFAVEQGLT